MHKIDYINVLQSGLTFHSQPIVNLHDKKIVGHELLARLKIGDSYVPPLTFIPDIEKQGLYGFLDERLSQYLVRYLENNDSNLFVSINVPSIESLKYHMMNEKIGDNASRVNLELLESVEWSHEKNMDVVEQASNRGFNLFLDDFGSGQSNLKTLLSDSVTGVKFDRVMLMTFIEKNKFSALERLVDMMCYLKKRVVFEGIESTFHEQFISRLSK
jgi:EAL domain-containing protein (putative c-di-GMP-specific phosphodiesterase class I)